MITLYSHSLQYFYSSSTVEDLTNRSENDMMKVRNLGKKSLDEVIAKLHSLGLNFRQEDE